MSTEKKPMGRPRIYKEPRARITVEIPFALLHAIDVAAAEAGVTRTRYIEQVMGRDPAVVKAGANEKGHRPQG